VPAAFRGGCTLLRIGSVRGDRRHVGPQVADPAAATVCWSGQGALRRRSIQKTRPWQILWCSSSSWDTNDIATIAPEKQSTRYQRVARLGRVLAGATVRTSDICDPTPPTPFFITCATVAAERMTAVGGTETLANRSDRSSSSARYARSARLNLPQDGCGTRAQAEIGGAWCIRCSKLRLPGLSSVSTVDRRTSNV
jgi:hypothetical protein